MMANIDGAKQMNCEELAACAAAMARELAIFDLLSSPRSPRVRAAMSRSLAETFEGLLPEPALRWS